MQLQTITVTSILTRTSGFLTTIASHSLQPYRGCALGNSLCGVGCYVRANIHLTRGLPWGSFLDLRTNAAGAYRRQYPREQAWGRAHTGAFGIFLSSSTEPFQPAERTARITRSVLEAMAESPPDVLIIQTHSPRVTDYLDLYPSLARKTRLRFHISIETDLARLPGLPPPASTPQQRFDAALALKEAGMNTVITVSPLLPIADPQAFFAQAARSADAVVIDHYIGGDGSPDGRRTLRTGLPAAIRQVNPQALTLAYRDEMAAIAQRYLPGRVGINIDGFAGRFLPVPA